MANFEQQKHELQLFFFCVIQVFLCYNDSFFHQLTGCAAVESIMQTFELHIAYLDLSTAHPFFLHT